MPTYRKDSEVKVVAPRSFTDHATAAEVQAAVDAKVDKMKMNLKSSEYREVFAEWDRLKQESEQRLQRLSLKQQYYQQNNRQQRTRQENPVEPTPTHTHTHNTETESSNVLKHLNLMRRIVSSGY